MIANISMVGRDIKINFNSAEKTAIRESETLVK